MASNPTATAGQLPESRACLQTVEVGHGVAMRLRDHHKGDLVLTALTVGVAAAAAVNEAARWAARRRQRRQAGARAAGNLRSGA